MFVMLKLRNVIFWKLLKMNLNTSQKRFIMRENQKTELALIWIRFGCTGHYRERNTD